MDLWDRFFGAKSIEEPMGRIKFSPEIKKAYRLPEWIDGYWDIDNHCVNLKINIHCVKVMSEEEWNSSGFREHIVFDMVRKLLRHVQNMMEGEVIRIGSTRLSALIILYAEQYYQWKMSLSYDYSTPKPDPVEFVIDKLKEVT